MVSSFSPNIQLEEPARGDQVGTWDTPVNANMTLLDLVIGGRTTITLNNSPVVLSAAQFQCATITFSSTLTGNVAITFPTSFTKSYHIRNLCSGTSAFIVTLATTAAGSQVICAPPGESIECINDGTNIYYHNLDRVGSYWDHGGSSVPNWISGCTIAPYLECAGGSFSSAAYPNLALYLGGTTLPDARGRYRAALNAGTGRITSGSGGVDGNTLLASGGLQITTLSSGNIPPCAVTDPGHVHGLQTLKGVANVAGGGSANCYGPVGTPPGSIFTDTNITGISVGSTNPSAFANIPPTYVGGITMIRTG